jgi:glycosyltransferase involved in cell wall biosynthesis
MQLTHINSYYYSNRLHAALVAKLAEQELTQHVFLPVSAEDKHSQPEVEGVSFNRSACFTKLQRLLWPLKMNRIWAAFRKDREQRPSQVNHAHTLFVNGLIAYWAKRKYGTPYIVTIRNTDVNQFLKKFPLFFRPLGEKIMRDAEAVVTLSHVYWDQHIGEIYSTEVFEEMDRKHFTIPNGCEDDWFDAVELKTKSEGPLRLVFVGLLATNKNLSGLLKACRILQERDFDFYLKVVGNGPFEEALKQEAIGLSVDFLGYVTDRDELRSIYRDSDLLVVPSFTESFGVVYAEAMSQGLPVIYSKGQGFDGFFTDGSIGYGVNPNDVNEIADCIEKVHEHYDKISLNVFANSRYFQWDRPVAQLCDLYRQAEASVS